ncbi:hypothetical protein ACHWQZ_G001393 [Mnemiopsis leidyi]
MFHSSLLLLLLVLLSQCEIRTREDGEITPVSAEQSATINKDEPNNGAGNAIDTDLTTSSLSEAASDGTCWLKLILDEIHCVQKVKGYSSTGATANSWTCTETDCSYCVGNYCNIFTLTINTEGTVSDLPSFSDCRYGDTVKLELFYYERLTVNEIAIIGKEKADCSKLDSGWSNAVTVPALPVVHGTTLTLNCDTDYNNKGGNMATCLYGQVVPTNQPPDCRLWSKY